MNVTDMLTIQLLSHVSAKRLIIMNNIAIIAFIGEEDYKST